MNEKSGNGADGFVQRLIICADVTQVTPAKVENALDGGDVATVVVHGGGQPIGQFADHCGEIAQICHARDVAMLVGDDTVAMGRTGADGVLFSRWNDEIKTDLARISPHKIAGVGGMLTRHKAMEIGEMNPDFLFFGLPDGDIKDGAHPKNLALAQWWAELFEIPCVVMGGSSLDSVGECAATGSEFIALGRAIFEPGADPSAAVAIANRSLGKG